MPGYLNFISGTVGGRAGQVTAWLTYDGQKHGPGGSALTIRTPIASNLALGLSVSASPATIENGDVVVVLVDADATEAAMNVTSPNLSFTQRATRTTGFSGATRIYTAVRSGATLTSEVVTWAMGASHYGTITVIVLSGADTSALTNTATTASTTTSDISLPVSAVGSNSYVFGQFNNGAAATTVTPGPNTTEIYDQTDGGGNGHWACRSTSVGGGTITLSGTWSAGSLNWAGVAIEIQSQ